jgi:hypothetical protein
MNNHFNQLCPYCGSQVVQAEAGLDTKHRVCNRSLTESLPRHLQASHTTVPDSSAQPLVNNSSSLPPRVLTRCPGAILPQSPGKVDSSRSGQLLFNGRGARNRWPDAMTLKIPVQMATRHMRGSLHAFPRHSALRGLVQNTDLAPRTCTVRNPEGAGKHLPLITPVPRQPWGTSPEGSGTWEKGLWPQTSGNHEDSRALAPRGTRLPFDSQAAGVVSADNRQAAHGGGSLVKLPRDGHRLMSGEESRQGPGCCVPDAAATRARTGTSAVWRARGTDRPLPRRRTHQMAMR